MYEHLKTITHTVDAAGFVLVRGKRVMNTPGVMLRSRPSDKVHCQLCGQCNVVMPLRVVSEFEHAINARRYFHAPPVVSAIYRLCKQCKESR